jgi:hypothetical protein
MFTPYWRWSIVCVAAARLLLNQAAAAPVTIGIALPQGQALQSPEVAEPLRQSLISQLKAQSIDAVPLSATSGALVDAEAQAKHCSYVLYTHLDKHSSNGLRGKWSAVTGALSFTPVSAQQPGTSPSPLYASVKQGDTLAMAYRLMAVESAEVVKADSFDSGKAASDGQDMVSPLVAQVAGAASAALHDAPAAAQATAPQATAPQATAAQGTAAQAVASSSSSDPSASSGRASSFGGLFGHRNAPSSKPAATMNGSMDCAKLASMPNSPMSVDACEKLQGAQQAYSQSASDPAASRPGDDQMSCTQITAELKQQQYTAPDRTKVAEAAATAKQQQENTQREYKNMLKEQAEDQSAVAAATAADNATELATLGLVRGHALDAAEKTIDERHKANNERVVKENLPVAQKMVSQTADFGADFGRQLQANPRLARLMQLADSKHCKGGT